MQSSKQSNFLFFIFPAICLLLAAAKMSLAADNSAIQNTWQNTPTTYSVIEYDSTGDSTGQNGEISGIIGDQASGQHLSGIQVYARLTSNFIIEAYEAETSTKSGQTRIIPANAQIYKALSAANGSYNINHLPVGLYQVWVGEKDSPYLTQYYNSNTEAAATPINIDGNRADSIDFNLLTGGSITGKISTAADGQIICDAAVSAYIKGSGTAVASTTSKEDGGYILQGLAAGSYTVKAGKNRAYVDFYYGGNGDKTSAIMLDSTLGSVTNEINFTLQQTGSISGKITAAGQVMANIAVIAYPAAAPLVPNPPRQLQRTISDQKGRYELSGLTPGNYTVVASPSKDYAPEAYGSTDLWHENITIQVNAGQQAGNIDFSLVNGGKIQGTITSEKSDIPIADAQVFIFEAAVGIKVGQSASNSLGNFNFDKLAAGDYLLLVKSDQFDDEFFDNAADLESSVKINITAGVVIPLEIKLASTQPDYKGAIKGKLTWDKDQSNIANACVYAFAYRTKGQQGSACAGVDGIYQLSGLADGEYRLCARSRGGFISECFENVPLQARNTATPITIIDQGIIVNINFALQKFGSISGTVTGAENDAEIGIYNIKNLAPGRYTLKINGSATGYQSGYYQNRAEVLVADGQARDGVDFLLPFE